MNPTPTPRISQSLRGFSQYDPGLEILETMANLIEAGELAAMVDLPSQKVLELTDRQDVQYLQRLMKTWLQIFLKDVGGVQ